ncbi:hypothetical protein CEXT_262611 [Caerostris extrusa]|uniref:Uncharacterized protein n=1 Tax=Caerostris extrusa TaxID=172846 RepID=A0AAV4R545_CAEEX|nr:hypothetical protein CEXT_262611 [Caerostris extrusa]
MDLRIESKVMNSFKTHEVPQIHEIEDIIIQRELYAKNHAGKQFSAVKQFTFVEVCKTSLLANSNDSVSPRLGVMSSPDDLKLFGCDVSSDRKLVSTIPLTSVFGNSIVSLSLPRLGPVIIGVAGISPWQLLSHGNGRHKYTTPLRSDEFPKYTMNRQWEEKKGHYISFQTNYPAPTQKMSPESNSSEHEQRERPLKRAAISSDLSGAVTVMHALGGPDC